MRFPRTGLIAVLIANLVFTVSFGAFALHIVSGVNALSDQLAQASLSDIAARKDAVDMVDRHAKAVTGRYVQLAEWMHTEFVVSMESVEQAHRQAVAALTAKVDALEEQLARRERDQ